MGKREKARRARLRKDAGGRVALAIFDFLRTKGWNVVMTTGAQIEGVVTANKRNEFRFVMNFVGSAPESGE